MKKIINFLKKVAAAIFEIPAFVLLAIGVILYSIGLVITSPKEVKAVLAQLKKLL